MKSNKFAARVFLAFLVLSHQVHALPVQPRATEQEWRLDADQNITHAVVAINRAGLAFNKGGSEAFLDALPAHLTRLSRSYLQKDLGKLGKYPRFELKNSKLRIKADGRATIEMDSFEVAQGNFTIDGKTYHYNPTIDLANNIDIWKTQARGRGAANALEEFFVPSAHASIPMALIFGGAAILGWLLFTSFKPKVSEYSNPAQEGSTVAGHRGAHGPSGVSGSASTPTQASPSPTISASPTATATPSSAPLATSTVAPTVGNLDDEQKKYADVFCEAGAPSTLANLILVYGKNAVPPSTNKSPGEFARAFSGEYTNANAQLPALEAGDTNEDREGYAGSKLQLLNKFLKSIGVSQADLNARQNASANDIDVAAGKFASQVAQKLKTFEAYGCGDKGTPCGGIDLVLTNGFRVRVKSRVPLDGKSSDGQGTGHSVTLLNSSNKETLLCTR